MMRNKTIPREYIFNDPEQGRLKVPLERWGWIAIYNDGTALKQFNDETLVFHQFKEIEQEKLETFVMQSYEDITKRYEIHMSDGMRPIHFYRNTVFNAATKHEKRIRTYMFGFQETVGGKNRKTLLQILPNDMISITNYDSRK